MKRADFCPFDLSMTCPYNSKCRGENQSIRLSVHLDLASKSGDQKLLKDLALVCGVYCEFHFPIGILGQVWYLIVSIPDLCTLTYFVLINILRDSLDIQGIVN